MPPTLEALADALADPALSFPDDDEHQILLVLLPGFLRDAVIAGALAPRDEWDAASLQLPVATIHIAGAEARELGSTLLADAALAQLAAAMLNRTIAHLAPAAIEPPVETVRVSKLVEVEAPEVAPDAFAGWLRDDEPADFHPCLIDR